MRKLIVASLVAVFLSGCATESVMTTGAGYSPTTPASVKLYQTGKPSAKYKEIGRVSIDKYNNFAIARSQEEQFRLLREKAASIGGDAVMNITSDFASVTGVVIKMK